MTPPSVLLRSDDIPLLTNSSRLARIHANLANTNLPVNRLPFEILVSIFRLCQPHKTKISFREADHSAEEDYSWIALTHVCQYWRHAALNCAALWQSISLTADPPRRYCGSIATAFFKRSHPLPIELDHTYQQFVGRRIPQQEKDLLNTFYEHLQQHPNRIKVLHLQEKIHPSIETLLTLPLPNLVSLQLWSTAVTSLYTVEYPAPPPSPENAPGLRCLSLNNFEWDFSPFPKLTHLYLTHYARLADELDFYGLMNLLKSCSSSLVALALDNAGPVVEDPSDYSEHEIIHLPCLETIELYPTTDSEDDFDSYILLFLHSLQLSDTVSIIWDSALTYFGDSDDEDEDDDDTDHHCCYRLPSPESLSRVTKLVIKLQELEGRFVLEGETLTADLLKDRVQSILPKLSRYLPNLSSLAISSVFKFGVWDIILALYHCLESLHLSIHPRLSDIIASIEGGLQIGEVDEAIDESDGSEGEDESDGEAETDRFVGDVDDDDSDAEINGAIGISSPLPLLSSLTIYTDNVDINSFFDRFSNELLARGLPELQLSEDLSMTRKRPKLGTSSFYTLQFRTGTIEHAVLS